MTVAVVAMAGLVAFGCEKTPVTGTERFIPFSRAQMAKLGNEAFRQVNAKETVSEDPFWNTVLERVGRRIVQATRQSSASSSDWTFTVFESRERNAFALPGGHVAVYTGMLRFLENEAQLAAVVGHEVAHVTARHGAQRMTVDLGAELGLEAIERFLEGKDVPERDLLFGALGLGAELGVKLPFSRANEEEADIIGLTYMARAGYLPESAVELWERMARAEQRPPVPAFLSTHPASGARARRLRERLPEVEDAYAKSARHGRGESW